MTNALALAQVMGPVFAMLGLSCLLYMNAWHKLLAKFEEDHLGLFTIMFMYAILGAIAVNMYNVWAWNVWLLVTLTGWTLVVKSVFYFLMPGNFIKKALALKKKPAVIYLGGVIGVVLGGILTYYAYFA